MKNYYFAFSLILLSGNACASEPASHEQDATKYCYLDGKAYSVGSRVKQNNEVKQCKKIDGVNLVWATPDKKSQ